MIAVDKGKLKFLLKGRPIQVDVRHEHRKGRIYAVRRADARSSICRAMVLDAFELDNGGWRLTIRQATEERPRFLAASPGGLEYEVGPPAKPGGLGRWRLKPNGSEHQDYTEQPHLGARGEPQALSADDLERYARRAKEEHDERKAAEAEARPRTARIAALERAAEAGDQQAKRHLFVIDQRIQAHERGAPRSQNG